jgi:hypothetical protein
VPPLVDPFPFRALRDLIGVCRALYAAAKDRGASRVVLERIGSVGRELSRANAMARASQPGTEQRDAAWRRAEQAARWVGHLVAEHDQARPIVEAATKRVCRR